jgi:hypothetical protein
MKNRSDKPTPFLLVASGTRFDVRTENGRVLVNWLPLAGAIPLADYYAIPKGGSLTIEVWP